MTHMDTWLPLSIREALRIVGETHPREARKLAEFILAGQQMLLADLPLASAAHRVTGVYTNKPTVPGVMTELVEAVEELRQVVDGLHKPQEPGVLPFTMQPEDTDREDSNG